MIRAINAADVAAYFEGRDLQLIATAKAASMHYVLTEARPDGRIGIVALAGTRYDAKAVIVARADLQHNIVCYRLKD